MKDLWKRIRDGKEPVLVRNLILAIGGLVVAVGFDVDVEAILAVLAALGITTAATRQKVRPARHSKAT